MLVLVLQGLSFENTELLAEKRRQMCKSLEDEMSNGSLNNTEEKLLKSTGMTETHILSCFLYQELIGFTSPEYSRKEGRISVSNLTLIL